MIAGPLAGAAGLRGVDDGSAMGAMYRLKAYFGMVPADEMDFVDELAWFAWLVPLVKSGSCSDILAARSNDAFVQDAVTRSGNLWQRSRLNRERRRLAGSGLA